MTTIRDTTQLDLQEVDSTGTLKAGEKTLADLRKRKLIVQRLIFFLHLFVYLCTYFEIQERPVVHCEQKTRISVHQL